MSELLQKVSACLSAVDGKKAAIGVSGGRDSMCLLHAVINSGAVDKCNVLAVHVNHSIREQADSDEDFVRNFCAHNGIEFISKRVDAVGESKKNGLTLEQAARDLRYGVFYDLIKSRAADVVLTAHHALDNAETVLMHLFRGAGIDGVCGMSGRDGLDGFLLRPFINVYPQDIDEYCSANKIDYVVDSTNLCDDADRNFLRLNVMPLIEKRYKGAVRAVNGFAKECASVCEVVDGILDDKYISYDRGAVTLDDGAFVNRTLAARYVRRALKEFSLVDVTRAQIERVVDLKNMRTGAETELSNGVIAARENGRIALYLPRLPYSGETPLEMGINYIDGLAVAVERSEKDPRLVRGGAVDFSALNGSVLRFRRDGDMFTPFGGKRKKLKQYFIDKKIPKRLRDRIPLVCRGNDVLVIVGTEISDAVKQTETTTDKAVIAIKR